jgi:hypothetical protein
MKRLLWWCIAVTIALVTAATVIAFIGAASVIAAMFIVWEEEGRLLASDTPILFAAFKWLLGSTAVFTITWWIRQALLPGDSTFRLRTVDTTDQTPLHNLNDIALLVLVMVIMWTTSAGLALFRPIAVLALLALFYFGWQTRVLFHEIGHLVAARLMNFRLCKIQVGFGPLVWSCRFPNGLIAEWRALPRGGFMFAAPPSNDRFRLQQSVFVLAGPATDFVLIILMHRILRTVCGGPISAFQRGPLSALVGLLFWVTAVSTLSGLAPVKFRIGTRQVWTDGYWLLRLAMTASTQLAELAFNPYSSDSIKLLDTLLGPRSRESVTDAPRPTAPMQFKQQQARLREQIVPPVSGL